MLARPERDAAGGGFPIDDEGRSAAGRRPGRAGRNPVVTFPLPNQPLPPNWPDGPEQDYIGARLDIALNNLAMPRSGRVMRHDIEELIRSNSAR